jgi:hypothetical protein
LLAQEEEDKGYGARRLSRKRIGNAGDIQPARPRDSEPESSEGASVSFGARAVKTVRALDVEVAYGFDRVIQDTLVSAYFFGIKSGLNAGEARFNEPELECTTQRQY